MNSYKGMEKWYEAFMTANGRKGSAPLPVIVAGTKIDDTKGREVQTKDVEWPKKKGLEYREISSKANFGVKELVLDLLKALLG
jgi:GTPase SAR1 family protein